MSEGEQNLPAKYETRVNPELDVLATNFENSLLIRTKCAYVNSSGALDQKRIKFSNAPELVATVATNGPEDTTDASDVIEYLVQKGLHSVKGYGKVLFVDCTPTVENTQAEKPFADLRKEIGQATLFQILEIVRQQGINLEDYGDLKEYVQIEQELNQGLGIHYDYPALVFKLIQSLGSGRKGFLGGTKDHVHLIPVFNFGNNLLPVSNSAKFGEKDYFKTVSDDLAKEAARFYKLATAIRTLEPSGGFDRDGYGPYGRTLIVPEMVLCVLGKTSEWNEFPNVTRKVTEIKGGDKVKDVGRIRSYNDFMWQDMVSGKIDYSKGHAYFRQPRGLR